jgi:thymidylate kinase
MTTRPYTIGVEGPVCAGKTTLVLGLTQHLAGPTVTCVPDYADHVGGGRHLPPPVPRSIAEEEQALRVFLTIEAERTKPARDPAKQWTVVLIDRSVHTLLAHCYGLTRITGLDHASLAHRVLAGSDTPLWPDLILYLDVPQQAIDARNKGKFEAGNIFLDAGFNEGIRAYFLRLASQEPQRVIWLDATVSATMLHRLAGTQIANRPRRHGEGEER